MTENIQYISESSWVSIKTILPTFIMVLGAAMWINSGRAETQLLIQEVKSDLRVQLVQNQSLSEDVSELKSEVQFLREATTENRWSYEDMLRWTQRLSVSNPSISVPTPK